MQRREPGSALRRLISVQLRASLLNGLPGHRDSDRPLKQSGGSSQHSPTFPDLSLGVEVGRYQVLRKQ